MILIIVHNLIRVNINFEDFAVKYTWRSQSFQADEFLSMFFLSRIFSVLKSFRIARFGATFIIYIKD